MQAEGALKRARDPIDRLVVAARELALRADDALWRRRRVTSAEAFMEDCICHPLEMSEHLPGALAGP